MHPVTILQSAPSDRPVWVSRCMGSVEQWAARSGYGYETLADELFDWVAPERRKKLMGRTPILADLARLRWIESVLSQRGGLVVWIDADSLCLDPSWRLPELNIRFLAKSAGCKRMPKVGGARIVRLTMLSWASRRHRPCSLFLPIYPSPLLTARIPPHCSSDDWPEAVENPQ